MRVEETHRVVEELGFKAIFIRANVVNGKIWHDPYYEPLWDTLGEARRSCSDSTRRRARGPSRSAKASIPASVCARIYLAAGRADAGDGQLYRRRRDGASPEAASRVPRSELQLGAVARLAHGRIVRARRRPVHDRPRAGAELLLQAAVHHLGRTGDEDLGRPHDRPTSVPTIWVYSTDYPHGDSRYPKATEAFLKLPISDEDKRKILWDNCSRFYSVSERKGVLAK